MIKNIVLDLGGVLFDDSLSCWNELLGRDASDVEAAVMAANYYWLCDVGKISMADYESILGDNPLIEDIRRVLDVDNYFITYPLITENYEYVRELKHQGYNIYLLSNIGDEHLKYVKSIINADSLVDGAVYSCEEGMAKPDPAIFRLIMKRYNLDSSSTVFFDDKQRNVDAANETGLPARLFSSIDDIKTCLANGS
ncbi:MAG: HAD family phosphatase [Candidatus Saccharibacteria bacterium]|nr:HAD family phosphatase [Candidatus Saccharibacteria bacterium]